MKEFICYSCILFLTVLLFSCKEKLKEKVKVVDVSIKKKEIVLKKEKPIDFVIDYDTTKWNELIDSKISLDIRYATANNFVKKKLYNCPRCFLRPEVAKKILRINNILLRQGYKLKMFDCYRPRPIQQQLWNIKPDARYVTPPWKGSMHNRGLAVDLTITDIEGNELDMGTGYDYFGIKAYHTTTNLPQNVLRNRQLLKSIMKKHGFNPIRTEWWHYSYTKLPYPLSDWVWDCK